MSNKIIGSIQEHFSLGYSATVTAMWNDIIVGLVVSEGQKVKLLPF